MALNLDAYLLDTALKNIQAKASSVRGQAEGLKAKIDSGPVAADEILNMMRQFRIAYDLLQTAKSVPGLNAYAQTEFNDPVLDYVAAVTAVQNAMVDCYNWVNTNFPKDVEGYLLKDKIVDGLIENRQFTQADTVGLSTQLATLIAAFA